MNCSPEPRRARCASLPSHGGSCTFRILSPFQSSGCSEPLPGGCVTTSSGFHSQVRDSAQSFLTVHVPLYVSYIYVTAPRGWASLEHHTEMEFSFFYDTVLWRTGRSGGRRPRVWFCQR